MVQRAHRAVAPLAACVLVLSPAGGRAGRPDEGLASLVAKMSARVQSYYDRLTTVTFTESVLQEDLTAKLSTIGRPREFTYEVIVTSEPPRRKETRPQIRAERQLRFIDGKPVGRHHETECLDPEETFFDPLIFLLPPARDAYDFAPRAAGDGPIVLDFSEAKEERTQVTWKDSHCFSADGGRSAGAVWLDPETGDIVRLDKRLIRPFPIMMGHGGSMLSPVVVIEQIDLSMRLGRIVFQDPDETLMMPESIVTLTAVRNAQPRRRRITQTFSHFRRFMTGGRLRSPV